MVFSNFCNSFEEGGNFTENQDKIFDFADNYVFNRLKLNIFVIRHSWPNLPGNTLKEQGTYRCRGRNG